MSYADVGCGKLGAEKYDVLKKRAWTYSNRKDAVLEFMALNRKIGPAVLGGT